MQNKKEINGPSKEAETLFRSKYSAVYKHLLKFKEKLEKRNKAETGIRYEWYALQRWGANYLDDFSKRKIMYKDISQRLSFCLVPANYYCNNTVYFISDNPHLDFLLGCLNTNIVDWYYRTIAVQLGSKAVRMFSIYVNDLPIPYPSSDKEENEMESLLKAENYSGIEALVRKCYGLTPEEFEYIEKHYPIK